MADHPEMRYYAYKLFPPRPSFPADITEAEAAIMTEHIAYWTGLLMLPSCSLVTSASSNRRDPQRSS